MFWDHGRLAARKKKYLFLKRRFFMGFFSKDYFYEKEIKSSISILL